ncbi:MAG: hypothetical protein WHX93_09825 [bacterium]
MTAQLHESLILEGERVSMAFCPPIPEDHPRIVQLTEEEMKELDLPYLLFSSACWRGYIGHWEIKDGRFYLRKIAGCYKVIGDEPIFADWFSGIIKVPKGKLLHYVHMEFESVFEQELHIAIEKGKVVSSCVIDNRMKKFDRSKPSGKNLPGPRNPREHHKDARLNSTDGPTTARKEDFSWKSMLLAFVIATIISVVAARVAETKVTGNIIWTVMWIYLSIEAWKYWRWKALLPIPLSMFASGAVMLAGNIEKMSPTYMVVQAILNLGGLVAFYILLRKSRKRQLQEFSSAGRSGGFLRQDDRCQGSC